MRVLETFVGTPPSSIFAPQAMLADYEPEGETVEGGPRMQAWGPTNI